MHVLRAGIALAFAPHAHRLTSAPARLAVSQESFSQLVETLLVSPFSAPDARAATPPPPPPSPHPAGISKNWSLLYVWLQYAQWYKVLCWLMVLVLGGSEGLLPSSVREAFRVEELLLASETRAQVFIFGQCLPFVLTKTRHFLVTWAGSSWLVRLVFYSFFTSHVEVAATLVCDCIVAVRERPPTPSPPQSHPAHPHHHLAIARTADTSAQ